MSKIDLLKIARQLCSTLNVHLEDRQFNEVIIHIGTNNILRDSSPSSIDGLLQNIKICP